MDPARKGKGKGMAHRSATISSPRSFGATPLAPPSIIGGAPLILPSATITGMAKLMKSNSFFSTDFNGKLLDYERVYGIVTAAVEGKDLQACLGDHGSFQLTFTVPVGRSSVPAFLAKMHSMR